MSSRQGYYIIRAPALELKVTVEELGRLHIHEEIIPEILSWLVKKIESDGYFKDPVIVDEKTLVVLDGMHRVAAAKELGLPYVPVCLVDYDSPSIGLYAWSRVAERAGGPARLADALEAAASIGLRGVSVGDVGRGMALLSERRLAALAVAPDGLAGIEAPTGDIKEIYDLVKGLERALGAAGFKISYHTERDALELARRGSLALIPPTITKAEVRAVALRGQVFAHKATRHVIPARPLNVNVPLGWLRSGQPLGDVRERVAELLSARRVKKLPPGTVLDRRYDEELYVFE